MQQCFSLAVYIKMCFKDAKHKTHYIKRLYIIIFEIFKILKNLLKLIMYLIHIIEGIQLNSWLRSRRQTQQITINYGKNLNFGKHFITEIIEKGNSVIKNLIIVGQKISYLKLIKMIIQKYFLYISVLPDRSSCTKMFHLFLMDTIINHKVYQM